MARLFIAGAETQSVHADGLSDPGASGQPTADTSVFRSGAASWKCDSAAGNLDVFNGVDFAGVTGTTYYLRAYIRFTAIPSTRTPILRFNSAAAFLCSIRVDGTGHFQLYNDVAGTQIGSDAAVTLVTGTWYRFELAININAAAGADDYAEAWLDGVSAASSSALTLTTGAPASFYVGWTTAPGASRVLNWDDLVLDNAALPGAGAVVLLVPTGTSAAGTGWRLGTNAALGGAGSGSVDNTPPVGVADTAVGSDPKQIRNATSNANDSFDTTMTTYSAAGIGAADTINAVLPIIETGAPVTTGAKQGTVGVVSNPVIANIALAAGGTSGAFWSGTTAGTFPTGWKRSPGTMTASPTVTLGTAPVMRITQVTSSTRIAMVCFMGIYVDYTPAVAAQVPYRSPYPQLLVQ